MSDEPDYRPRSPDLSAFVLPPPPPRLTRLPSFQQDPTPPTVYDLHHRRSYDASPYFSPATSQPTTSYFGSQPHAEPQTHSPPAYQGQSSTPLNNTFATRYSLPSQGTPRLFSQSPVQSQPYSQYPKPVFSQPQYNSPISSPNMARTRNPVSYAEQDSSEDASYTSESLPQNRSSKKRKSDTLASQPSMMTQQTASIPISSVEVKTKFPVARIKRIMQADEDVGKVAQATPTAVSKALELFMITLVQKSATEARARNSKKVTAAHLKSALMQDEQFDFVKDICEKVQDVGEKKSRAAGKSEADDSADAMSDGEATAGKKRKGKSKGS